MTDQRVKDDFEQLKAGGLSPEREERLRRELSDAFSHGMPAEPAEDGGALPGGPKNVYQYFDLFELQEARPPHVPYTTCLRS